jgi:hypothetical protein
MVFAHWDEPESHEDIRRALSGLVRDRQLVPYMKREWRQLPRVFRPNPAAERWPEGGGGFSPKPEIISYADFVALQKANGELGKVASSARLTAALDPLSDRSGAAGGGAVQASSFADRALGDSTPLGSAKLFEYHAVSPDGFAFDIAKTPNFGEPGTWYTNPASGQMRLYGADGRPVIDLDFDHIHNGLRPHAHNWGPSGRDTGFDVVPFSPWSR